MCKIQSENKKRTVAYKWKFSKSLQRNPGIQRRTDYGGAWPGQIELDITSCVFNQFGRQIKATILETPDRLDVTSAKVTVVGKDALDCTLRARVECAVFRACDKSQANIPWVGVIK